ILRGHTGSGVAIGLLWLLWAGGALGSRGGAGLLLVPLSLAAGALWAASLFDLSQRLAGHRPLLTGRLLAWSALVVAGLLAVVALASGVGGGG
ncbi:MAG: hypothetical protein ACLFV0_05095, partial [Nitriliruptoraceae bacterium]